MLGLVLANNYLQFFVGWEIMGACSYLLISFEFERDAAEELHALMLDAARRWVEAHGLGLFGEMNAPASASFSIHDPDGHEIELYVDLRAG